MQGDKLASGGKSATFGPPSVTKKRWEEIFGPRDNKPEPKVKDVPKR
jgi:hypothetical protein